MKLTTYQIILFIVIILIVGAIGYHSWAIYKGGDHDYDEDFELVAE